MYGIILAAGIGLRLKQEIKINCKSLIEINGQKLIEFSLNNLIDINVEKIIIVVGEDGELIKNAIGYKYKDVPIIYVLQPTPKGIVNAIIQSIPFVEGNDIALSLSDEMFIDCKAKEMLDFFKNSENAFVCGVTEESREAEIKKNYTIDVGEDNFIKRCIEKPKEILSFFKGTGFCLFRYEALEFLIKYNDEEKNAPVDLCDWINSLISIKKTGRYFIVAKEEVNINFFADYKYALSLFG